MSEKLIGLLRQRSSARNIIIPISDQELKDWMEICENGHKNKNAPPNISPEARPLIKRKNALEEIFSLAREYITPILAKRLAKSAKIIV
ncbi:MAG: hypothetical protein ACMUIU_05200 [bacterium]